MKVTFIKIIIFILLSLILSACSTSAFNDLFSNYNQQMREVKQAQQQGNFQQAISLIPSRNSGDSSYNLHLLEKARLAFLATDIEQSQTDFEQVYQLIQQAQLSAKVELSRGVENVAAIMSNDNATRYDIPFYEQSMLHTYQALNYLAQKDLSGALVEVRRANLVQEQALKSNADSILKNQEQMSAQGLSINELDSKYPTMNNAIGNVKNGFQNAYTFYLSALLYEAAGQRNDAYIDYKKALEIYPNNSYIQQDVWRLANNLSMSADISLLKTTLPDTIINKNNKLDKKNNGQVIVITENGIVAAKQEIALNLPIFTRYNQTRFYSVALPSYQNYLTSYSPLSLQYQGKSYQSQEIVRLQSLAAKQLKDDLPAMVTRQIVRLVAKEELRQQLSRNNGELGNLFASIYNLATEKADTRSWSTLPDSIHIMRLDFPVGEHNISLNLNGVNQSVEISVNPNRITLIKLTAIGTFHQYQTYNL
ncbi:hypothetical protein Q4503_03140 [Colwellia sp. 6_MG-2023]|uniref:COG3014 family protein n=1 Tax=Colwellia sp. 6_MG-2023 TaxID=3062676 RepID=UPI0026E2D8F6|nr:hypothetical protein [Colwellia sp. 6_MG-2023]MDO6486680.1 hypothetical protein [Colwellia sp. 6_MG-2023]